MAFRARKVFGSFEKRTPGILDTGSGIRQPPGFLHTGRVAMLQPLSLFVETIYRRWEIITSCIAFILYSRRAFLKRPENFSGPKVFRGSFRFIFSGPGKCFSKPPETARISSERFGIFLWLAHGRH